MWITTVTNTDWPSRPGLSVVQQQTELTSILDRAKALGINAVMFQVRPAADAVYASSLEPWAALLMGSQGADPGYDPLAFAVAAAHERGLELHAWINPFRAGNAKDSAGFAPTHLFRARRDLVRVYGTQLWLDPGEPAVHDHAMRVVRDLVSRYDLDGIHADDYFYPYQQNDAAGKTIDFPDSASYARSGSTMARDDWRRDNVNRFVERLYREVHQLQPAVKVGLSPFGIWRPGNPASVAGLDAYATLYADSRQWLQQGWVDYLAPQLYWAIAAPQQSYPALLDWWFAQNTMGRHVWPGLATYRTNSSSAKSFTADEIPAQIRLTRLRPAGTGHIHFNTTTTLRDEMATSLAPLYPTAALIPASPWLGDVSPAAPAMSVAGRTVQLTPAAGASPRWWVIRSRVAGVWKTRVLFGDARAVVLDGDADRVVVNAVDRAGNTSPDVAWTK